MALPDRVLVDTSAFYALRSATDRYHRRANGAYERFDRPRAGVVDNILYFGRDSRPAASAFGL